MVSVFPQQGSATPEDKLKALIDLDAQQESCAPKGLTFPRLWVLCRRDALKRFDEKKEDCMNQSNQNEITALYCRLSQDDGRTESPTASRTNGISWSGTHGSTASNPAFMWMTAIPEAASTAPASSR